MCITRHAEESNDSLDLNPTAKRSVYNELKKGKSIFYQGEYLVIKREPFCRRRGGGRGVRQTSVVQS